MIMLLIQNNFLLTHHFKNDKVLFDFLSMHYIIVETSVFVKFSIILNIFRIINFVRHSRSRSCFCLGINTIIRSSWLQNTLIVAKDFLQLLGPKNVEIHRIMTIYPKCAHFEAKLQSYGVIYCNKEVRLLKWIH